MEYQKQEQADRHMPNIRGSWNRLGTGAILVSCLFVFLLGSTLPALAALVREPYLQLATPTSITILWRTDLTCSNDSRVMYGTDSGNLNLPALGAAGIPGSNAAVKDHLVMITDLDPGTKYFYNVGTVTGGGLPADCTGGGTTEHYFVTPPLVGTAVPFRAWVVGDSGNASQDQIDVREAMLAYTGSTPPAPDIYLHVGDIAYANGTDDEFTDNVFTIYQNILRHTPMWPSLGNHDSFSADTNLGIGPYYEAYVLPTAGQAGGASSGTEAYYSFDYANVHFVVLDSMDSDLQPCVAPATCMLSWLEDDLALTNQDWVIAYWHHPPYTKGTHDSDSAADSGERLVDMRENVLSILEAGGVNLVLGGHSHIYERSYPVTGAYGYSPADPNHPTPPLATLQADGHIPSPVGDGDPNGDGAYQNGPVYVVAGHGGRSVGQQPGGLLHPVMFFKEVDFGSVLLDFDGSRVTGRNVRSDGLGAWTVTDLFAIDLAPLNMAPTVNAGLDQTIILPLGATLDGTVTDDNLPNPPATVTTTWTQVSGPGTVTFADSTMVDTTANFTAVGTYVLRLTADDSLLMTSDDVTIMVDPSAGGNLPPTAMAGPDQAITLPNAAIMDGFINDDGLPNPDGAVTATWSQFSGPGTVTFGDDTALDTSATFSEDGTYVLRLTADDGLLMTTDDVTITVNPAPPFVAFNDLAWGTGQLTTNITTITSPNGQLVLPSTGQLIDFATGNPTGVTLTVTGGSFIGDVHAAQGNADPSTGDAFTLFDGKVSGQGVISYINAAGSDLVLTFTGLNPNQFYDLAFYAHRNNYAWDRASEVTISGQDTFINTSSVADDNPLTLPRR